MSVEVLDYRLEVRGVPAGRQTLRSKEEGRHARLEAEASFEGPLGRATVTQLSRCHRDKMTSYEFRETTRDRAGERRLRVEFDGRDGLVRMARGDADVAETPLVQAFRDPLSMLRELRRAAPDVGRLRIPMLGKTVEARVVGEVDLDTPLGPRRARAFLLHPGGSWAWVDVEAPHAILKLSQRTDDGAIDAWLVGVGQEARLPAWEAEERAGPGGERRRGGKRRRGKRRRRKGRGGRGGSRGGGASGDA